MEQSELTLRNGLVASPEGSLRGGVAATGGLITHVGPDATLPTGQHDLDVGGHVIFPGVIDPHVHIGVGDNWGPEKMQADFESESRDAAFGGITTLLTTTLFGRESRVEVTQQGIGWGNERSLVDFRFNVVMIKREDIDEVPALVALGVRSFKFFLGYKGPQGRELRHGPGRGALGLLLRQL